VIGLVVSLGGGSARCLRRFHDDGDDDDDDTYSVLTIRMLRPRFGSAAWDRRLGFQQVE